MNISPYAIPGIKECDKIIFPEAIEQAVSDYYCVSVVEMHKRSRSRDRVTCRQITSWLMRKHTHLTLKVIGSWYGKDHTTAIHSIQAAANLIETNEGIREDVRKIERRIASIYNQ